MKRIFLLIAVSLGLSLQSCGQRVESSSSGDDLTEVIVPQKNTPLKRYAYRVWYSDQMRIPLAVAWYLTGNHVSGSFKRKGVAFHPDEEVSNPVTTFDYMQSGYSRGHMCPSGDNKWSQRAQEESFLMTNICPQNGKLNGGDWNDLEVLCRTWAKRYDRVYIVCGPVLRGDSHKTIGRQRSRRITVPEAFYKVVLRTGKNPAAIGFIYDNNGSSQPMHQAVRSVDEIEQITGLDFFSSLPDDVEHPRLPTGRILKMPPPLQPKRWRQVFLLLNYNFFAVNDVKTLLRRLSTKPATVDGVPHIRHHTSDIFHRLDTRRCCSVNPLEIVEVFCS